MFTDTFLQYSPSSREDTGSNYLILYVKIQPEFFHFIICENYQGKGNMPLKIR